VPVVTPRGYAICHEMKTDKGTRVQCDLFPVAAVPVCLLSSQRFPLFGVGSSERPGRDGGGISGPDVGDSEPYHIHIIRCQLHGRKSMRLFTSFTVKERLSCTTMRHEYCWDLQWAYCSKMFVQSSVQSKLTRADWFFLNWLPGVDITHSFKYQCLIVSNTPRNLIGHIFTPSSWLFLMQ